VCSKDPSERVGRWTRCVCRWKRRSSCGDSGITYEPFESGGRAEDEDSRRVTVHAKGMRETHRDGGRAASVKFKALRACVHREMTFEDDVALVLRMGVTWRRRVLGEQELDQSVPASDRLARYADRRQRSDEPQSFALAASRPRRLANRGTSHEQTLVRSHRSPKDDPPLRISERLPRKRLRQPGTHASERHSVGSRANARDDRRRYPFRVNATVSRAPGLLLLRTTRSSGTAKCRVLLLVPALPKQASEQTGPCARSSSIATVTGHRDSATPSASTRQSGADQSSRHSTVEARPEQRPDLAVPAATARATTVVCNRVTHAARTQTRSR
jgi:hypothetical protein